MALHKLTLPPTADLLREVVGLLQKMLDALAEPNLVAATVNAAWVQSVWTGQDAEWVRKFCLGGQEARIQAMASAPLAVRRALRDEFRRQNDFSAVFNAGGDFSDFATLLGGNAALAGAAGEFFKKCYALLGHRTNDGWHGYALPGGSVSKHSYSESFRSSGSTPASDA